MKLWPNDKLKLEAERNEALLKDVFACKPGDVLVLNLSKSQSGTFPVLYARRDYKDSVEDVKADSLKRLRFGARALVIQAIDTWFFVLVEQRIGWITWFDVDHVEFAPR